jgi:hypothetical protein
MVSKLKLAFISISTDYNYWCIFIYKLINIALYL